MNSRFLGIFCDTPTVVNILGQLTVDSSFFCINVYCLLIIKYQKIKYQKILLQKSSHPFHQKVTFNLQESVHPKVSSNELEPSEESTYTS